MPILSAFVAGLLFRNVDARAAIAGVVWGVSLYGAFSFWLEPAGLIPMHYIDFMVVTLVTSIIAALVFNRAVFGKRAEFLGLSAFRKGGEIPAAQT
jgi:SSS family solute:Na+ symporter